MASTSCVNSPDKLCYICGNMVAKRQLKSITEGVKVKFHEHFGIAIRHQDKPWAPHVVCTTCYTHLWSACKRPRQGLEDLYGLVKDKLKSSLIE